MRLRHTPCTSSWNIPLTIRLCLVALLLTMSIGCAQDRQHLLDSEGAETWQPGQVLDTKTGRLLSSSDWLKGIANYEVVYLGEEHHNQHHIDVALQVMDQLLSEGFQPVLGMEMFGWDGQPALDAYLSKSLLSRKDFIDQVRWTQNWGGEFEDYEPLVTFARDRGVSILAMNPPRPLIRRIVKTGLAKVREEPEWTQWGMHEEDIIDDPTYRARITDQLQRCHGGGGHEDHFRTMYEASMARDEGMAKTLAAELKTLHQGTHESRTVIVSYTGGGHIQYNLPVPMRVARRVPSQLKQTSVYMTSFDTSRLEDIRELADEGVADYIWLTPTGKNGPPKRCR